HRPLPAGLAARPSAGRQSHQNRATPNPADPEPQPMQWTSPEEVGRLLFAPDGLLLASTRSQDDDAGTDVLRLWAPIRGREVAPLAGLDPVFSLAFASPRELVVIEEHRCLLWGPDAGAARTLWEDPDDPTWRAARRFTGGTVSPDGKVLALAL